jgi:intein/homing endonuclease
MENYQSGNISPTMLAYMAGFFDAEGCVTTSKRRINRHPIHCEITQQTREVLDLIKSYFEGAISFAIIGRKRGLYKICFGTLATRKFLEAISPYLIVKKEQAQVAIEYYDLMMGKCAENHRKLTESDIRYEQDVARLLSKLKDKQISQSLLTPPKTDDEAKSYIAGIFDGEGSVYITRRIRQGRSVGHTLCCSITQNLKVLVEYAQSLFGGKVVVSSRAKKKDGGEIEYYRWRIFYRKAKGFLEQIEPYLIIKKSQANLGIEFQNGCVLTGKEITPEVVALRDSQRELMHKLKDTLPVGVNN